jgi:hypothetical protein
MRPDDWLDAVLAEVVVGFAEMTTAARLNIDSLQPIDSQINDRLYSIDMSTNNRL